MAQDHIARQIRTCGQCSNGTLSCVRTEDFSFQGVYAGREYTFRCGVCDYELEDLSAGRVLFHLVELPFLGSSGSLLGSVAVAVLIDHDVRDGDWMAIGGLLLFLLGGWAVALMALNTSATLVHQWITRLASPVRHDP